MAGQPEGYATFLPDTNLYIAAIKGAPRKTDSLALLLRLLEVDAYDLVGDRLLLEEYRRYGERFATSTALSLLGGIARKLRVVEPAERFIVACEPYFPATQIADVLHAATCLETGAVLISNDRHFDAIARAGMIQRPTLTQAIRRVLP